MKSRYISFFIFFSLLLSLPFASALSSLANFNPIRDYDYRFSDVTPDSWFFPYVSSAFEFGILDGVSNDLFLPDNKISLAEVAKLAAVIHKSFFSGSTYFEPRDPWFAPFVEYIQKHNILYGDYNNYYADATRADFALILAAALPDELLTPINDIPNGAIPDVFENYSYGAAVYKLYRAGVLSGADDLGRFFPAKSISRAEVAAAIMRLIDADLRSSFSLPLELSPQALYELASPAVFFIEVFDDAGDLVKTGSGFFIDPSGLAVTNYHVITGARSADVTLSDGQVLPISGIFDFDIESDIALINVDGDSNFHFLDLGDSDSLVTGQTIFAIGSPLGLKNSFSKGIISASHRIIEDNTFIQLDASISSGSSGGALLDSSGKVVGITSAAVNGGQSLNLAVPINLLNNLQRDTSNDLDGLIPDVSFYSNFNGVPDFGAFFDVKPFFVKDMGSTADFSYLVSDLESSPDVILSLYTDLLNRCLFTYFGNFLINYFPFTAYYNSQFDMLVMIGINQIDGNDCITVSIS